MKSSSMEAVQLMGFALTLFISLFSVVYSVTDLNDLAIINEFKKGLENSEL